MLPKYSCYVLGVLLDAKYTKKYFYLIFFKLFTLTQTPLHLINEKRRRGSRKFVYWIPVLNQYLYFNFYKKKSYALLNALSRLK